MAIFTKWLDELLNFFRKNEINMSIKKRHHYIPECYSKNFSNACGQKYIYVYDKDKDSYPDLRHIRDTGVIGHYNSFVKASEERDTNTIEDMFNEAESVWPDLIFKFSNRKLISSIDLNNLCTFVALMHIRVPNFRLRHNSRIGERYKTTTILSCDLAVTGERIANMPNDILKVLTPKQLINLRDNLLKDKVKIIVNDQINLSVLKVFMNLHKYLLEINWSVMTSEFHQDFVISDNPMVWHDLFDRNNIVPYKGGISNPNIEVIFPLTKRLVLIGNRVFNHKFAYGLITKEKEVQRLNEAIIIAAEKYVYASQNNLNNLVQKFKDVAPRIAFKHFPLMNGEKGYRTISWPTLGSRKQFSVNY